MPTEVQSPISRKGSKAGSVARAERPPADRAPTALSGPAKTIGIEATREEI
jgi:hypothetical protein